MVWKVEFEQEAERDLSRLDKQYAKRILKYLFERIATPEDPRRFGESLKFDLSGLGVIKHLGEICHRILSNVNTPKVLRQKSTSNFKALPAPIILEVKIQ